jgi:DNA-binding transcriptional MerR regulator
MGHRGVHRLGDGYLTTGRAAARIGIHPNTLRWYEAQGRMPSVPRSPGGYRLFSPLLLLQARIVHACHRIVWMVGPIRRHSFRIMELSKAGRFAEADSVARNIRELIAGERELAEQALGVLFRWRRGETEQTPHPPRHEPLSLGSGRRPLTVGQAARRLSLGPDQIRNWERNGLCRIPRAHPSGYRSLGREELELLLVIRYCQRAGYSLTAIRRMLQVIRRIVPDSIAEVRALADSPLPAETALFDPYPTDTLPTTLAGCAAATEQIISLLVELQEGNAAAAPSSAASAPSDSV